MKKNNQISAEFSEYLERFRAEVLQYKEGVMLLLGTHPERALTIIAFASNRDEEALLFMGGKITNKCMVLKNKNAFGFSPAEMESFINGAAEREQIKPYQPPKMIWSKVLKAIYFVYDLLPYRIKRILRRIKIIKKIKQKFVY